MLARQVIAGLTSRSGRSSVKPPDDESVRSQRAVLNIARVATPERFELPTVSLGRTCSIQLSYGAGCA